MSFFFSLVKLFKLLGILFIRSNFITNPRGTSMYSYKKQKVIPACEELKQYKYSFDIINKSTWVSFLLLLHENIERSWLLQILCFV